MVSDNNLINYPYLNILFTLHTDAYDKNLGTAISQNNSPIEFLSKILRKSQCKYPMM